MAFYHHNDDRSASLKLRVVVMKTLGVVVVTCLCGCRPTPVGPQLPTKPTVVTYRDRQVEVWGRKGRGPGEFFEPRAVVADQHGHIYVVDSTGRIQKFSSSGVFIKQWRMPAVEAGKPESLGIDPNGDLLVPDTHYHRMLVYSAEGKLLRRWGKRGDKASITAEPGDFIFVNGATATTGGRVFTTEYGGSFARIQEFTRKGEAVRAFGSYGVEPGQFRRPGGPCINAESQLIVCDSPNHRVQVFTLEGKLLRSVGKPGRAVGELGYPYSVAVDNAGNYYVAEWGNHRVQKFDREWRPLETWGQGGTRPGELYKPWGVAVDGQGYVYVADHENHRIQKFRM